MDKYVFHALGKQLASFMATIRKEAGLTQVELARRLSRPQPMISHIERGERRVDMLEFCEIAWALGQDPVEIFARFSREVLGPERNRPTGP
ncbi:helix-turn-helix transcriptional regulator [Sphingomonas sanguinis]|uniref:helix-turn-helix domain-containing protein n=1 Tax=Sphingomonas sp. LC-1 TaxID=3110957 RepID=UPI0021BB5AD5|nr:helix-turn-helix transcriptional regulator [Sphingomonas sp. LC-1]MCT8000627.1 helix-turn-helix transcriptional regulator [Sphingomonas sp. LC-1]